MGVFARGQIVLLHYPFSDLSNSKRRPGVILAAAGREDWIVCQITSNPFNDSRAFPITKADFQTGRLDHTSYIRPGKLFTAHESLILKNLGELQPATFVKICDAVIAMIQAR